MTLSVYERSLGLGLGVYDRDSEFRVLSFRVRVRLDVSVCHDDVF